MGIPAFDSDGLLPQGIHECTLSQAQRLLCKNSRRQSLWGKLAQFLTWYEIHGIGGQIHIDGSFVTDKDHPDDVDVIVDMHSASPAEQIAALQFLANHQDHIRAKYEVDFWVQIPGMPNNFVNFFQYIGIKTAVAKGLQPKSRKGILRVMP